MNSHLKRYPGDVWLLDPQLQMASAGAKGVWIAALCSMWDAGRNTISGTPEQLARLLCITQQEFTAFLVEAEGLGFADIQRSRDSVITLTSRRMTLRKGRAGDRDE